MSNFDDSFRLKRNRPSSSRRSRSVSRGSESIAVRNLQIKNNENFSKTVNKKKKLTNDSYWDEDGFLINVHQNENQPKNEKIINEDITNKTYLNPRSIAILMSTQTHNRSIIETAEPSPKQINSVESKSSQKKRSPSEKVTRNNFAKFIERQQKSAEKHVNTDNNIVKQERFMNKESEKIFKRSNKQTSSIMSTSQRRRKSPHYKDEEYSFRPDLSKTLHKNVNGLSCQLTEANVVLKNIQITAIKVEQEEIERKNFTYKPQLTSNPKMMEEAKANREKIMQRKKEKYREIVKSAKKEDTEEDECKSVKFYKKVPSRTKELNDMLKVFKEAGKEGMNDQSEP